MIKTSFSGGENPWGKDNDSKWIGTERGKSIIRSILEKHPDGLTAKQISEMTGLSYAYVSGTMRKQRGVYIDKWIANRELGVHFVPVYCRGYEENAPVPYTVGEMIVDVLTRYKELSTREIAEMTGLTKQAVTNRCRTLHNVVSTNASTRKSTEPAVWSLKWS